MTFLGPWIFLRVSSSKTTDKSLGGHSWCAIQIGPLVEDVRAQRPEFGWVEGGKYGAFPIIKVKTFKLTKVSQWGEGAPFRLVDCDETSTLRER